jgi:hypothetical protein
MMGRSHTRYQGQVTIFTTIPVAWDLSCRRSGELYSRREVQTVVMQKGVPRPPMRAFIEPNRDYAMDLSKYDMVYFFGDSMIQQLARRFQTNLYWNDRIFIKKM